MELEFFGFNHPLILPKLILILGCFREKDCGKCFTCVQNEGKCCMDRVCVQVEELLKQKFREKVRRQEMNVINQI